MVISILGGLASLILKCTPIVRLCLTIGGAFFMAKFSSTEKIQAVKRYLDGTESGKTIAKSIGVTPSVLREWIRRYESSGEKAFEVLYILPSPA